MDILFNIFLFVIKFSHKFIKQNTKNMYEMKCNYIVIKMINQTCRITQRKKYNRS